LVAGTADASPSRRPASRLSKMTIMPGDDIGLGRQLIVVQILLRVLMAEVIHLSSQRAMLPKWKIQKIGRDLQDLVTSYSDLEADEREIEAAKEIAHMQIDALLRMFV
jgi:hypothetical protein